MDDYTGLTLNTDRMMRQRQAQVASHFTLKKWVYFAISCILLVSLGFPGLYVDIFGGAVKTVLEYTAFFMQIFIMIFFSGNSLGQLSLISLNRMYSWIYFFLITVFVVSMIGTSDAKEEAISCIRVSVTAFFSLWMCDHLDLEEMLTCIYNSMILYVIAAVSFAVLFPGHYERLSDQSNAFLGMENTKNVTAMILCIGIIMQYLLWKIRSSRNRGVSGFFVVFFAVQIFLMILSDSTGATMTCLLTIFLVMWFGDNVRVNLGMVHVLASVFFLIGAMTILPILAPALEAIGEDASLSGRLPLWQHLLDVIRTNHTMVGYGYGHFWLDKESVDLVHTGFSMNSFMAKQTGGAHNNLIELWLNTGLIGMLSFAAMLIGSFSRPQQIKSDNYIFCLAFMAFYTLVGFTERGWSTYGYKMVFLFIAAGLACRKQAAD